MALELRQQLKLSQQLVMTPQLQQAIKLLQLSRVELLETVQQELLENPFLEEAPANEPVAPQDQEEPRHEKPQDEVYDEDLSRNADWEEYLGEFASTPRTSQGRELEIAEEISPLEARYSAKPTLEGHLLWLSAGQRGRDRRDGVHHAGGRADRAGARTAFRPGGRGGPGCPRMSAGAAEEPALRP